ncbi:hypothetical protein DFO70_10676 [Cytobacillus firmus]|uniref:Uncharacterized protein n=2 Tax=Cytobacillus TaxID=2675230 RepID=A0A366JUQ7_CYTFI|nr:hypothetical protein DFO70_10676 [Cytobacillus firmus]TDX42549.1 hypothetical protein DFO72_10676 [Cytobacillus oceanisediminis]
MLSKEENLLFIRELGRLQADLYNCSDDQVRNSIHQDILLLLKALSMTAMN